LDCSGSISERAIDGPGGEPRISAERRNGKLYRGSGHSFTEFLDRSDQQRGICNGDSQPDKFFFQRPAERLRFTRTRALPNHLRERGCRGIDELVAGGVQVVTGQTFQPLTVRVTDSSTPPNPVLGASVLFQSTVMRPSGDGFTIVTGDSTTTQTGMPSILSATQSLVPSNVNGLAGIVPSVGSFNGLLEIEIQVSAGTAAFIQDVLETFP
jgi:hypothetical protein